MQAKTQSEQELTEMIAALNETITRQTADLDRLKCELETEADRRISAENQAESLRMEKEQSETSLRSSLTALQSHLDDLQAKFETTREALRTEENTTQSLKENLAEIVAENEKSFETLTLEHNRLIVCTYRRRETGCLCRAGTRNAVADKNAVRAGADRDDHRPQRDNNPADCGPDPAEM